MSQNIPKLQKTKTKEGSIRYSANLPLKVIKATKFTKGDKLLFLKHTDDTIVIVNLSKNKKYKEDLKKFKKLKPLIHTQIVTAKQYDFEKSRLRSYLDND